MVSAMLVAAARGLNASVVGNSETGAPRSIAKRGVYMDDSVIGRSVIAVCLPINSAL